MQGHQTHRGKRRTMTVTPFPPQRIWCSVGDGAWAGAWLLPLPAKSNLCHYVGGKRDCVTVYVDVALVWGV